MIKIVLATGIYFAAVLCAAQSDAVKAGFRGKVKHVKEEVYMLYPNGRGGVTKSGPTLWVEYDYNENGQQTIHTEYSNYGGINWLYKNEYDSLNRKISQTYMLADYTVTYRMVFEYDKKNRLSGYKTYNLFDTLVFEQANNYTKKGLLAESKYYGKYGVLSAICRYVFDKKGNRIGENWLGAAGTITKQITTNFDKDGNAIEVKHVNADGELIQRWEQVFDTAGRIQEVKFWTTTNQYDTRTTFHYDENGNMNQKLQYDFRDSVISEFKYEYEYDSLQNWTSKTEREPRNTNPAKKTERTISYFDL